MKQYLDAVKYVLENGTRKENRTGVDTLSAFNVNYTVDLKKGFPLMTTKSVSWKNIVVEMLWFLSGSANLKLLEKHNCKFWDPWKDQWGHLGPVYGKQWRRWETLHLKTKNTFENNFTIKPRQKGESKKVADVGIYTLNDRRDLPFGELLYNTWSEMLYRCYDKNRKHYKWYGGNGVHVCERWHDFKSFVHDVQLLDGWHLKRIFPDEYSLDKDFNRSNMYGPDTCIWLSEKEQRLNNTTTKLIRVTRPDGIQFVTLDVAGVCSDYDLDVSTVHKVLKGVRKDSKNFKFSYEPYPEDTLPRVRINDQIHDVIAQLKTNSLSRRMIVSAWNPSEIHLMKLPPCHSMYVINVQKDKYGENEICLHLTQRSADIALGVPYNIASYSLLIELFARFSGMRAGRFGHTMVDAHIYTGKPDGSMSEYDHIPGLREQLTRTPKALPKLIISDDIKCLNDVEALMKEDTATIMSKFILEGYDPDPAIKFKVAV